MQTQTGRSGSYVRALGMRGALLAIAERAEAEAMRCTHVLASLDLERARACHELARRATELSHAILAWRHPTTPQDRRLADALTYQEIVRGATELLADDDRPTIP